MQVTHSKQIGKPPGHGYSLCAGPAVDASQPLILSQKNGGPAHVGLAPNDSRGWCAFVARMARAGFPIVRSGKLRGAFLRDVEAFLRGQAIAPAPKQTEPMGLGARLELIASGRAA
jgi:hypothetical protein